MLRQRTSSGTQVLSAGQTSSALQIVSLAGQTGFSRTANVHGFASSSTATRAGQTQTRTRTQAPTRTSVTAAGAPAPGDPGGSRTMTVFEDEKKKDREKRIRDAADKRRLKAAEKGARQRQKLELKKTRKEARRAEGGGCFGRKAASTATTATTTGVSTPGPRPVDIVSTPKTGAAATVSMSGLRATGGGGAPSNHAGGGTREMSIAAGPKEVRTNDPINNVGVHKKSGCFGFRWPLKRGA